MNEQDHAALTELLAAMARGEAPDPALAARLENEPELRQALIDQLEMDRLLRTGPAPSEGAGLVGRVMEDIRRPRGEQLLDATMAEVRRRAASSEGQQMTNDEQTMFDPGFGTSSMTASTPASAPPLRLRVSEPGLPATERELAPGAHQVGSDPGCAVLVSTSGVSANHARLSWSEGAWWVEDLGSKNGTYLDKQLVGRARLTSGSQLHLGPVQIDVHSAGQQATAPPPAVVSAAPRSPRSMILTIAATLMIVIFGGLIVRGRKPAQVGGSGNTPAPDQTMAQFASAMQTSVEALQKGNYRDASQYLSAAHALKKTTITQTLIEINTILQGNPTEHITELIEKCDKLRVLKHKIWLDSGVTAYGATQYAKWKDEQDNATFASKGDAMFDKGSWREARAWYRKIKRNSEFKVARQKKDNTCKLKIAEELRDRGNQLMAAGRADEAVVAYQEAIDIAPPDLQNELIALRQEAANNQRYAQMLRKGMEARNAGSLNAAKAQLEQIPEKSVYFKKAVELLEAIARTQTKHRALALYRDGKGDIAVRLLANAVSDELRALREQIDRVHRVYTQAQQLYEQERYAQANELWVALKNLVGDRGNQYYKWADAGIRVDPVKLAATLAKEAQLLYSRGKYIEAGTQNTKALQFDGKNADALKLKKTMVRKVTLKYSIARQKWQNSGDDKAFLKEVIPYYRWLRATDAIHRKLAGMAEAIVKAGGEVPPAEKKRDEDD